MAGPRNATALKLRLDRGRLGARSGCPTRSFLWLPVTGPPPGGKRALGRIGWGRGGGCR